MSKKYILDQEEKDLLESFEAGELKRSKNAVDEIALAKKLATQHNRKDARINIRLSNFDLNRIKRIAAREGIPYQTLISSILHKYIGQNLEC